MPGPLPNPGHRRRNAATISTTLLPAGGRPGPAPKLPSWVTLGEAGSAWWAWAWKTPQAAAWSAGDLVVVARRAGIEDDLAARHDAPTLDVAELLDLEPFYRTAELEWLLRTIHRLATGKTTLDREARELDDRLGLTPKGFAALRWSIEKTDQPAAAAKPKSSTAKRSRMKVIDGGGAA